MTNVIRMRFNRYETKTSGFTRNFVGSQRVESLSFSLVATVSRPRPLKLLIRELRRATAERCGNQVRQTLVPANKAISSARITTNLVSDTNFNSPPATLCTPTSRERLEGPCIPEIESVYISPSLSQVRFAICRSTYRRWCRIPEVVGFAGHR